jgi:CRP-like cAMP-binding protein
MILPPNTVLVDEKDDDLPICYSVVSGEIRVFKKDSDWHSTVLHNHVKEE